jgi:CheY-like chemotaxis protein
MSEESTLDVGAKPVRILVAEDEALIRMDLIEMLREAGYTSALKPLMGKKQLIWHVNIAQISASLM